MNGQMKNVGMHPRPQNQSLAKAPHQIKAGQKKKKKKNKLLSNSLFTRLRRHNIVTSQGKNPPQK